MQSKNETPIYMIQYSIVNWSAQVPKNVARYETQAVHFDTYEVTRPRGPREQKTTFDTRYYINEDEG